MPKRISTDGRGRKSVREPSIGRAQENDEPSVELDVGVQSHLGAMLREMYDSTLKEPIPERFLDLLRQIDSTGGSPASDSTPAERSDERD